MTPSDIQIRPAQTGDIDAMVELLRQLFSIEKDFTFEPENHKKGLLLMLDGCGKHKSVNVAVKEEKVVGMCTAQLRISTASGRIAALIEDMIVDEKHRGEGIGKALLTYMEEWAAFRGIQNLSLLADIENYQALNFYQKNKWNRTQLTCLTRTL